MRGILRRFARGDDGATAIEFGLVAGPFLLLMFAIIETALIFFATQAMDTAASDSARLILTGQAQKQKFSQSRFQQEVCDRMHGLLDCGALKVDVRTFTSFSAISTAKPIDKDKKVSLTTVYQPGNAGEIVVVRLLYEWPVRVSFFGLSLADLAGEKRLLMSAAAFRNEPFPNSN